MTHPPQNGVWNASKAHPKSDLQVVNELEFEEWVNSLKENRRFPKTGAMLRARIVHLR